MARTTAAKRLITGCFLLIAGASSAYAQTPKYSPADLINAFKPDFPGVQISTPAPDEYASCEVKLVPGAKANSSSWVLLDAKKQLVRRFTSTTGKGIDIWSYFKDGLEVYRETDSDFDGKKDQYRWMHSGGMKWGQAQTAGKIDFWKMISSEEVGQEMFAALAAGDVARMQALFISEAEMRQLKLAAAEMQRISGLVKGAAAKFQATRAKMPHLNKDARFVRVESATPNCVPADVNGTDTDQLRYPQRTILFEGGDKEKKHDWVQTGEMIKVGMTWRLIDGPSVSENELPAPGANNNPALVKLFDDLTALDKSAPAPLPQPMVNKAVQDYNVQRVAIITKILEHVKGAEQDSWIQQICDNLSAAYQAGHSQSITALAQRRDGLVSAMPGSNLAAYAAYRHLLASYADQMAKNPAKAQDLWLEDLAKFAQTYPKSEDTPDALDQLAVGSEFSGKDEQAKRYYKLLYTEFPTHPSAAMARGSEKRLDLIGRDLELASPQLGINMPFNITSLKGKAVVVYYWSSDVNVCAADFVTLNRLRSAHAKDMELVCVNLDANAQAATAYLQKHKVLGVHLWQAGGRSGPLATQYGIQGLPHLFLVGKDGRVIDRTLQVRDLEDLLKKAL